MRNLLKDLSWKTCETYIVKNKMNKKPKINKKILNKKRSLSRLMAAQILFQHDFFKGARNLEEIKEEVIENYALEIEENVSSYRDKIDGDLLNNLITGLTLNIQKIDEDIAEFLQEGWTIERLEDMTRQLLRLGAFELKFMIDVPLKVVIDEYVDIAACFSEGKKVTFVNATLENLAKKFRAEEFEKIKTQK